MSGVGYGTQSSSGFMGMTVPETIQLSTEGEQSRPSQYRPMQVPDRITLDEASSTVTSPANNNEEAWQDRNYRVEPLTSDVKTKEVTSTQVRFTPHLPPDFETTANTFNDGDVDLRLGSLENRVSRLESRVGKGQPSGPGRFWYVVTFSAWMMLPLAVVFMFYYRRNS